jgi:hypothetical protein
MKIRKIVPLLVAAAAAGFLSGCATHTANGKNHTVVLGGLIESREGAYEAEPVSTAPINGEKPLPGAKMNGNKISILWGLVSYRDQ